MNILFAITNCDDPQQCQTTFPNVTADTGQLTQLIQLALGIIAIVAVIYIVIAGIKLIISQGDPTAVAKSRQSIIYAALGLIIAMSAEIIVTFVIGKL